MMHLKENNETYLSHLLFAGKIGLTLIFRGLVFLLHALIPVCNIPERWNLSNTTNQLDQWNTYTFRRFKKD
jgi:hypothetical protein|tara:strand:- start:1131 stop:1343 length:213 start_codon:yes stop_codon:yes gene_type:complete